LANANEAPDWRIYAAFAQRLTAQARRLYASESLGIELTNAVYALDAITIDLCLSVFPWAHFRSTKAAVKMHTLLDLRGNIPTFIHISDCKMRDVRALDELVVGPLVTRAKSNTDAHRFYSVASDRAAGIIYDQTIALDSSYTSQDCPERLRRIRFRDPETGRNLVFLTSYFVLPAATICALYKGS
jgi:hypothetical protein